MRLDIGFKSFPADEKEALPTLGGLMEIAGYVSLNADGTPSGPIRTVCIRPRKGTAGKIFKSYLAPESDYDRIALRCLFSSAETRMVFSVHPQDGKPRMGVVDLEDSSQLEDIRKFGLKGLFATPAAIKDMPIGMLGLAPLWVPSLHVNWSDAVMEGPWRLPDYR
jgi:hypothetical protein